jgi:glutathione S-transferase
LFSDLIALAVPIWFNPDAAAKKVAAAEFLEGKGKAIFTYLENLLKANGSNGWLVGNSLTVADLTWADLEAT